MFRRLTAIAAILIALTCCAARPAAAQAPVAPAQNVQPGAPAPNVTIGQRTFYFEIFLVVALFGGALFAVCRSSNRR